MTNNNEHIRDLEKKSADFFSKGIINWDKSEEQVWAELEKKIKKTPSGRKVFLSSKIFKYAAAAIFMLIVGLGCLVVFYQKSFESLPGQHLTVELPDDSQVQMNAGSSMKYFPLRWSFERKIKFEGEGYFEVEKGKKFEVESANGITEVLGTSFNIYARDENYRVTCLTGKVKVTINKEESVVLLPNSHAEKDNGKLTVNKNYKVEKALGWKNNQFFFAGRPLQEVIDELERQYAVTIRLQPELNNRNFASNFSKKYNVEEVLDFICKSMQIKFVKQSENVFLIVEKS